MIPIKSKTAIPANKPGDWIDVTDKTNIFVGVDSGHHVVELKLSDDTMIYGKAANDWIDGVANLSVIAKANFVRVVNHGESAINYEVYV